MLKSELARELGIEPSVMSKRLKLYVGLAGIGEPGRYLDDKIVRDMEEVHKLLQDEPAMSTREAVQRVLGQFIEAVPPAIALSIDQRLTALEEGQGRLDAMVTEMLTYMRQTRERRAAQVPQVQEDIHSLTGDRVLPHQAI